jgi:metal-responsive CopG/Arc/MetJ family transcriptional regulator
MMLLAALEMMPRRDIECVGERNQMVTKVRTTLTLPEDLLAAVDRIVDDGGARNRGDLIADAIRKEIVARRRQEIDDAFTAMGRDVEYQREATSIMNEFARADGEMWSKLPE